MSEAVLGLLDSLGVAERFVVVGHDRGARVARRMAADHPERVVGAALLDIMPLEWVFDQGSAGYARRYYHWYFMLQRGIAEAAMGAVPRAFAINQTLQFSAVPVVDPALKKRRIVLAGEVPSAIHPPPGCPFHPRCPVAEARCRTERPVLRKLGEDQFVACHLAT